MTLLTGADSVMIARGACMNLSVFGKKQVSTDEVMKDYLRMVRALCASDQIRTKQGRN
jgi:tRNA-dihydrouridine synthase